jgi:hypothetical protein
MRRDLGERPLSDADSRVARFVEAVKDDPRVLGVARLDDDFPGSPILLVVTTWDGFDALSPDLPRVASPLLADGPRIEHRIDGEWTGVDAEGARAVVRLRRVGDLVPTPEGPHAKALADPRGFVATWIKCCRSAPDFPVEPQPEQLAEMQLMSDWFVRMLTEHPEPRTVGELSPLTLDVRAGLRDDHPAEAALARRIDAMLRVDPQPGAGVRVSAFTHPADKFESFLAIADAEGFKGDRVLFAQAVAHLRKLSNREPVFDHGFLVPTFDAVEAAFALDEGVGGCRVPLVPGVYVGVGVTPTDALEFWAAPFVRVATSSVACVDDTGERDVVPRTAGKDALLSALTSAIDAAYERLPALLDAARAAERDSVDPAKALAPLHLPRTFVERAKRHGADALMCSRLTVALALCAAGENTSPLVARKLGLAAGRVLVGR